jgi:hypothetical protein
MLSNAFGKPVAVGLNLTVIAQLAFAAMFVPQVLISEKSPALVPLIVIPVKFNCVLPVFVSVILLIVPTFWFPKGKLWLDNDTTVPSPCSPNAPGPVFHQMASGWPTFLMNRDSRKYLSSRWMIPLPESKPLDKEGVRLAGPRRGESYFTCLVPRSCP